MRTRGASAPATAQAAGRAGRLGKESTEFRPPADLQRRGGRGAAEEREKYAKERKSRRFANRRTLWKITGDRSARGCGRAMMDPEAGMVLARTATGSVVALGLLKCGKLWICPVCSAKIRNGRAREISRAAVEWMLRGGTAYLVTFTARHAASHRLADLMDAIQGTRADAGKGIKRQPGAYQRLITGAAWAGDARKKGNLTGIRGRVGYLGMIRATEVTVSQENGFHPHIHALVLVGAKTTGTGKDKQITGTFTPSESALAELEDHFRAVWTRHLAKVDPDFTPSDEHGVDFKKLRTERDALNFGLYVAKLQDGSRTISPAHEIAGGDTKSAKGKSMTPFQLLGRIGDLMGGVAPEDAEGHGDLDWCLAKWSEYESGVKGRRAIEWTRHLRTMLGIEGGDGEEDDMDMLWDLDGVSEFVSGVNIETKAWHRVAGKALDFATMEAAERGRYQEVTELVVTAGSRSGAVRELSPTDILQAWEGILTKLAERRKAAAQRRLVERAAEMAR